MCHVIRVACAIAKAVAMPTAPHRTAPSVIKIVYQITRGPVRVGFGTTKGQLTFDLRGVTPATA